MKPKKIVEKMSDTIAVAKKPSTFQDFGGMASLLDSIQS
jgi:hypothetical protein